MTMFLTLKLSGNRRAIRAFLDDLAALYGPSPVSPLVKNDRDPGHHAFTTLNVDALDSDIALFVRREQRMNDRRVLYFKSTS
jgi:hypothetical protein